MKTIDIIKFKNGEKCTADDVVAEECLLRVETNFGMRFDAILSPEDVKYFVYGHLLSEGWINAKEDVKLYEESTVEDTIYVIVELKNFSNQMQLKRNYTTIWTECGSTPMVRNLTESFEKIGTAMRINAEALLKLQAAVKQRTELFKLTGAYHYAFLFDKDLSVVSYAYDIGRHNAVDKVIGRHLFYNDGFENKILFTTGRVTSDIVFKCLRVKIPLIISRSAPLLAAVQVARKYNVGLIGFFRGRRYNLYSNEKLIDFSGVLKK